MSLRIRTDIDTTAIMPSTNNAPVFPSGRTTVNSQAAQKASVVKTAILLFFWYLASFSIRVFRSYEPYSFLLVLRNRNILNRTDATQYPTSSQLAMGVVRDQLVNIITGTSSRLIQSRLSFAFALRLANLRYRVWRICSSFTISLPSSSSSTRRYVVFSSLNSSRLKSFYTTSWSDGRAHRTQEECHFQEWALWEERVFYPFPQSSRCSSWRAISMSWCCSHRGSLGNFSTDWSILPEKGHRLQSDCPKRSSIPYILSYGTSWPFLWIPVLYSPFVWDTVHNN